MSPLGTADFAPAGMFDRGKKMRRATWAVVALFAVATLLLRANILTSVSLPLFATFVLCFVFAVLHGTPRYGWRAMLAWFALAWGVSNFFEGLSITTGFPFGHYHYTVGGPHLWKVPIGIMPIYFGIGYVSWTVAQAVTGLFDAPLVGWWRLVQPLCTALVMTMWDLVTDPQASTINGTWIWEQGGVYFGVPISNFAGWVFVVYVFMQLFALLSFQPAPPSDRSRAQWLQPVAVYLVMGLGVVLEGFIQTVHREIYGSMAMVAVFTMVFTGALALLAICRATPGTAAPR